MLIKRRIFIAISHETWNTNEGLIPEKNPKHFRRFSPLSHGSDTKTFSQPFTLDRMRCIWIKQWLEYDWDLITISLVSIRTLSKLKNVYNSLIIKVVYILKSLSC